MDDHSQFCNQGTCSYVLTLIVAVCKYLQPVQVRLNLTDVAQC
jgi:hypothetical protein